MNDHKKQKMKKIEEWRINLHQPRVFADCPVLQLLRWLDAWIQEKPQEPFLPHRLPASVQHKGTIGLPVGGHQNRIQDGECLNRSLGFGKFEEG